MSSLSNKTPVFQESKDETRQLIENYISYSHHFVDSSILQLSYIMSVLNVDNLVSKIVQFLPRAKEVVAPGQFDERRGLLDRRSGGVDSSEPRMDMGERSNSGRVCRRKRARSS